MKPSNQFERTWLQRWTAMLFVLVVAVFGFVQAVHVHDGLATDGSPTGPAVHCLICVAAHSAPVITTISFTPVLAFTETMVAAAEPQLCSRLSISAAFIRPPPQIL